MSDRTEEVENMSLPELEVEIKRQEALKLLKLNFLIETYHSKLFCLTISWIVLILIIIICAGFKCLDYDNSVLIALITTTTVNVFVFFVLVVRYIFQQPIKNNEIEGKKL